MWTRARPLALTLLIAAGVGACTTTSPSRPASNPQSDPQSDQGSDRAEGRPPAIVGAWELSQENSIITCTLTAEAGSSRTSGPARVNGCPGLGGVIFISEWKREGRRIVFSGISIPRLIVRRVDRDEFAGIVPDTFDRRIPVRLVRR